jgi:hypothetical protein
MAPLTSLVKYDSPVQVGATKDARGRGTKDKSPAKRVRGRWQVGNPHAAVKARTRWRC